MFILGIKCYLVEESTRIRNADHIITSSDSLHYPTGVIEFYHFGVWGKICRSGSSNIATIACRGLGYPSGSSTDDNSNNQITSKVWIRYISCSSSANSLSQCYKTYDRNTCYRSWTVACNRKYLIIFPHRCHISNYRLHINIIT